MLSGARGNNSTSGRLTSEDRLRGCAPCVVRLSVNAPWLFARAVLRSRDHPHAPMASGVEHWGCVVSRRVRTSHPGSFIAWPAGVERRRCGGGRGRTVNAAKKRYERLKSDGRCVICTATAAGGVWCLSCAAKAKQRRADIFASGLCRTCGLRSYTAVRDRRFTARHWRHSPDPSLRCVRGASFPVPESVLRKAS